MADLNRLVQDHLASMRRLEEQATHLRAEAAEATELRGKLDDAQRRLTQTTAALERTEARAARLDQQMRRITSSKAWKLISAYRDVRHRLSPASTPPEPSAQQQDASTTTDGAPNPVDPALLLSPRDPEAMDQFRASIDAWAERARNADGGDVVVMFSGTTFVQEHRGNRPIRLTNVYLEQRSPVFFSYYRWTTEEPLPEHADDLLFQSPIDVTPMVLPEVFDRDFGTRRKVFYVSFPHLDAVRMMSLAKANGWTTVYDIRDDWEAFAEVGAAHWWFLELERLTVQNADIVTAVSAPLADKLSIDADRQDIHVNGNAFDATFPAAPTRPSVPPRTVGYFGHLTGQWFDWDLIIAAAKALPDWTFELAGHGAPADLPLPDNVVLLGQQSHSQLAERSAGWAGGLIPFKNGPIVDPLDPIKVYEYIHLQLPTVAGYYPPMHAYPGVELCESPEDFIAAIARLPERCVTAEEATAFLAHNRWHDRVASYSALVDDQTAHRAPRGLFDAFLRPPAEVTS